MYKIDLTTLLHLFEEFQRSGTLIAEVPRGTFGLKEPGVARVELIHGKIAACSIIRKNSGILASGSNALQMLQQVENLKWQIQTPSGPIQAPPEFGPPPITEVPPPFSITPRSLPRPPMNTTPLNSSRDYLFAVLVPQRRTVPNQWILHSLTPKQRRVLSLVDGIRNVSKIASLLAIPIQDAQKVLEELEVMQLISRR